MAMFANGEQYKEIGFSNFATQNNNPRLLATVAANKTNRVSDSLVGSPLSTGNLQPTAGAVGFTEAYSNATITGKMLLAGASIGLFLKVPGGLITRTAAGAAAFYGGSLLFDKMRGD